MAEKFVREEEKKFKTDSGYAGERRREGGLTPAAEDYLEMIYRLSDRENGGDEPVRICTLASELSVSPSSASRMAGQMALAGYVDYKRYGYITLTDSGAKMGEYLVRRHTIVLDFLFLLTGRDSLVETERIEHYLSPETVEAMANIVGGQRKL